MGDAGERERERERRENKRPRKSSKVAPEPRCGSVVEAAAATAVVYLPKINLRQRETPGENLERRDGMERRGNLVGG